ncbi:MAG: ABC transporter permease [Polyangiales bacterium]
MIPIQYSVRSLMVRKATTIATALGVALVVFVLASALMLSAGVRKTLAVGGKPDVAIVLRRGSDAELGSTIDAAQVNVLLATTGIRHDGSGKPIGSGEVIVVGALEKIGASGVSNVQIRGVTEASLRLRPDVKIIAGRAPKPGSDECMIGERLRGRFKGLDVDQSFDLRKNRPAHVVGVFSASGSSYESEVWVDLDTLRAAFGREAMVSSIRVQLESEGGYDAFKANVESDKSLGYLVMRDAEYFERQSEGTAKFITVLGALISVFFAIGAMIGAMITMYSAIANRQREIGTLRALGFSRTSVLTAFLLESVLLSLLGGVVGTVASLGMGFVKFSMLNLASWSEIVFSFDPTPAILLRAMVFAVVMGLFGGLFPAVQAARVSAIRAMRA